ncbi:N-acetylmuramoyl-L-alanine amidase [Neobacillus sp. MM2021_6]|uniref:peptidoglycan recognition protein family protein n=1 Tax=Bacillaceae TaxID=186817 RepID=UPI00140AA41B|nr:MULTISPECIES: N-acetylmuramoyl-L-alanine amidase [Bacillaceae]MBO0961634.1 N-acetylmuramoyl-L-alanine amidase [Neobacillus sp. MM2021_6]NHC19451.1 hypothetical protein [Bacillus sp. MM2020_4]
MPPWTEDIIKINKYSRPGLKLTAVKKIVEHFTANPGGSAKNHVTYFGKTLIEQNEKLPKKDRRYASAHIFVDKKEALLLVPLNEAAYHANDVQQKNKNGSPWRGIKDLAPNANLLSIGVELCIESDGTFHPDTIQRAAEVNAELCKMYKLDPIDDIVRHYDVTHKNCPAPWVANPQAFIGFKNSVKTYMTPEKGVEDVLKAGDKGEAVKVLNYQLASLGYISWADRESDVFGNSTLKALKKFQKEQRIKETGEYDAKTALQFAKILAIYYDRLKKNLML